jgi:hypothetical protein
MRWAERVRMMMMGVIMRWAKRMMMMGVKREDAILVDRRESPVEIIVVEVLSPMAASAPARCRVVNGAVLVNQQVILVIVVRAPSSVQPRAESREASGTLAHEAHGTHDAKDEYGADADGGVDEGAPTSADSDRQMRSLVLQCWQQMWVSGWRHPH